MGTLPGSGRRILDHPVLGPLPSAVTVRLTIDGRAIEARAGEPLAAALLAAGVRVFRTMPRSGEARGAYCMVGRCADCAMSVDGLLNVQTCVTSVREGMIVVTQLGLGGWHEADGGASA